MSRDTEILHSWQRNADAWIDTIRERQIESRRLVTDRALLDVIQAQQRAPVIDVGCGEGWLVRALAELGIHAVGVDGVQRVIEHARSQGGEFHVASYADIAEGRFMRKAPLLVSNFALLDEHGVAPLLRALTTWLERGGRLIVQTVHPWSACGDAPYEDGWRVERWQGFGDGYTAPAPWYFRTLSSWLDVFNASGWQVCALHEPLHPQTRKPVSVLFVLSLA